MPRFRIGLAVSCAACAALACALNPVSRRPEVVLVTEAQEKKLGDAEAQRVEQEMGLVEAPEITAYVRAVGARLTEHSPRQGVEYRFAIVDDTMLNAFALPGGHVYVTRGLLSRLNSEDELAYVIGHEIGHVAGRHAVQRATRAAPLSVATGIPAAAVGLVLPDVGRAIGDLGQLANSLALAPYSRGQETESDRLGQDMAAASGWDPLGIAAFMHTLQREEALRGADDPPWFVRTHPLSEERLTEGTAHAATLTVAANDPIAGSHADFLSRLDGLLVGGNPAEGVFEENVFLHPDLDLRIVFPRDWKTTNARAFVAAQAPDAAAQSVFTLAGRGDDPLAVARAFAQREGAAFGLMPVQTQLGRFRAARAYGRSGGTTVDVSWIAIRGNVYQITGACKNGDYDTYQTPFIDVALSLRPLTPEERAGIRESRLRIIPARSGESLRELVERMGGTWGVDETAVANALEADEPLRAGQLLKVPVPQAYEGGPGSPAGSPPPEGGEARPSLSEPVPSGDS
jgi:predicted Zn-dependent protease